MHIQYVYRATLLASHILFLKIFVLYVDWHVDNVEITFKDDLY